MPHIKASLSFLSLRNWQGRHIWLFFLYLFFFITRCLLHATFICWWLFYWYFYAQACWLCPPFQVKCPQVLFAQMWGRYEPKKLSWENTNNKCKYHKYLKGQRLIYTQHIFLMRRCTSHVLKRVIYWMRGTSKDLQKEKRDNQTNFINKVSVKFLSFWMFGGRNWGKCRNNNLILKQFDHLVFIVCVK